MARQAIDVRQARMGFFDSLFGRRAPARLDVVADKIWMTTDAKFAGLAREVAQRSSPPTVAILLVAHFPDVLARLDELAAAPSAVPVKAVPAGDLSPGLAAGLRLDESALVDIIVGERHPLPSVDEQLARFADELPCRCRLSHHLSLEDPVVRAFAGEWVQSVLRSLGMTEDEPIESVMVSRRIKQAQREIESKSHVHTDAGSAAEWLAKNCPDLAGK